MERRSLTTSDVAVTFPKKFQWRVLLIAIVMGVTGAGKTTVGSLLAKDLGWRFADADSFHSAENVEKMSRGLPLDDADRIPWLASLRAAILQWAAQHRNVVLACSSLRRSYRYQLEIGAEVKFVYLKGSYELISKRLLARHGHFATDAILASQFEALEEPDNAIVIDVNADPQQLVTQIKQRLKVSPDS